MDFKSYIAEKIAAATEGDKENIFALIEKPKDEAMGDAAFPCFSLSKVLRKAPNMIAAEIDKKITLCKQYQPIKLFTLLTELSTVSRAFFIVSRIKRWLAPAGAPNIRL